MGSASRRRWLTFLVAVPVLFLTSAGPTPGADTSFPTRSLEPFSFTKHLGTTGKLKPRRNLTVKSKISEEVEELPVNEGDTVPAGTALLLFDTDLLKVRLDRARHREARARHQRDLARKDFKRKQSLLGKDLVSQAEFDRSRMEYDRARENLKIAAADRREAQIQFRNTRVKSPFPGVLEERVVELGEQVNRGEPLLEFLQVHPIELQFEVTPEERRHLEPGDTVFVQLPAMNSSADTAETPEYSGRITTLNQSTNPNGLYTVKTLLPNGDRELHPGRTVDVRIPLRTFESVVEIPLTYLDRTSNETRVVLYDPDADRLRRRPLNVVDYRGESVLVRLEWPETWELVPGGIYTDLPNNDR